jgi:hypothetical protein
VLSPGQACVRFSWQRGLWCSLQSISASETELRGCQGRFQRCLEFCVGVGLVRSAQPDVGHRSNIVGHKRGSQSEFVRFYLSQRECNAGSGWTHCSNVRRLKSLAHRCRWGRCPSGARTRLFMICCAHTSQRAASTLISFDRRIAERRRCFCAPPGLHRTGRGHSPVPVMRLRGEKRGRL